VEAARAGIHGKGFAIVADEVRSLATKSSGAVDEITVLIENSSTKVSEGTQNAQTTAQSLERIIADISGISQMIEEIALSSGDQVNAVSQINVSLNKITGVAQNNSSTAKDSASTAKDLSRQSELLLNLISEFRLKTSSH